MNEETDYRRQRIEPEVRRLLTMAGLPLIDGFFLAFLLTGLWREPGNALAFGMTAFSGAACFIAAMGLQGCLLHRLSRVLGVYAVIGLGAVAVAAAQPFFRSILPNNLFLFTGVFLLGLGLHISGIRRLQVVANRTGYQAAVAAMLTASLVNGVIRGPVWRLSLDLEVLPALGLAVGAGLGLTTLGMLLGLALGQAAEQRPLNWGAGLSLVLMGLNVLGAPVPSVAVITPLALGCAATLTLAARAWRGSAQKAPDVCRPAGPSMVRETKA